MKSFLFDLLLLASFAAVVHSLRLLFGFLSKGVPITIDYRRRPSLLFRASRAQAANASAQRIAFLRAQMGEGISRFEIIEVPPHLEGDPRLKRRRPLSLEDSVGQDVILRAQASEASRLDQVLLGRAVDAVVSILRSERLLSTGSRRHLSAGTKIEVVLTSYAQLDPSQKFLTDAEDLSPWVVLVGTNHRHRLAEHLRLLSEWLGVGVVVLDPAELELQKTCKCSPGRQGVVAGFFLDCGDQCEGRSLALTCAHVLPPNCPEAVFRADWASGPQPDVALLPLTDRCFRADYRPRACVLPLGPEVLALEQEARAAGRPASAFLRVGGSSSNKLGQVVGSGLLYEVDGMLAMFDHLIVKVPQRRYFWLFPWPLFPAFSREGDSGAWVMRLSEKREWLGMLVAGDKRRSIVLKGGSLLRFCELLHDQPGNRQRSKLGAVLLEEA